MRKPMSRPLWNSSSAASEARHVERRAGPLFLEREVELLAGLALLKEFRMGTRFSFVASVERPLKVSLAKVDAPRITRRP